MKNFYLNYYNRFVILSWVVIITLLWIQYIYLSTFLEATLIQIIFIPIIFISNTLTNKLLPVAIQKKSMRLFIVQYIGTALLIAFIFAIIYQVFRKAEEWGYFPPSLLLADANSFLFDFLFAIPSSLVINFGFCGLRFYYEHMKLHKAHLETQLQVLQSQINPHFMFNILNHIHILIQTDVTLASSLLLQYADILRYQLYSGKYESVELEQDVQFLKNFVEIEKTRWGDKINVFCHWETEDKGKQIPPLLFITFVENAFKHVSRSSTTENYIRIHFVQQKNVICLEVENSKSNILPKNKHSGLGLVNIKNRLDILYGENYRLLIEDKDTVYHSKLEIWQK